tara:strand:+ start:1131 stop:1463 length:333 start_codon:yes stop_codon:yes gene_type:complete
MWNRLIALRSSVLSLLLVFALLSGYAEAWTANEWQGIIEATAGAVSGRQNPVKPDTGDVCQDCDGTGKVGDGRVMVKCQTCDGTGKKLKAQKEKESADKSAGNFQCRAFC